MRILVVNDDGIFSSGIVMLARAAQHFGSVTVSAPAGQRSGMSQHITVHGDITVSEVPDFPLSGVRAFQNSGTPADSVRVGMWYAMDAAPDLVLSGINDGFNTGRDILYSGTVGACKEAVCMGVPAMAFSVGRFAFLDDYEEYLIPLIEDLLAHPAGENAFWNVNFPKRHKEECKGILTDRAPSTGIYFRTKYVPKETGPDGVPLEIQMTFPERMEEGSDIQAVLDGYISVGKVGHILPSVP